VSGRNCERGEEEGASCYQCVHCLSGSLSVGQSHAAQLGFTVRWSFSAAFAKSLWPFCFYSCCTLGFCNVNKFYVHLLLSFAYQYQLVHEHGTQCISSCLHLRVAVYEQVHCRANVRVLGVDFHRHFSIIALCSLRSRSAY